MSFISRISEEDNNESPSRVFTRGSKNSSANNIMESGSAAKLGDSQKKQAAVVVVDKNETNTVRFNNEAEVLEVSKNEAYYREQEEVEEEQVYNDEETRLLNNLREQLYDSVVKGHIEKVEALLDLPYADINLTWYSENLLMCALRAKQEKMAEFLIHRGIDVTYEVDLFEFKERSKVPIRYEFYSCRQMAYDYGLINIVALIDFFHERTSKKIVKYIGRKLLKTNDIKNQERIKLLDKHRLLEKRLVETFIKKEDKELSAADVQQMTQQSYGSFRDQNELEKSKTSFDYESENIMYDEIDNAKPISISVMESHGKRSDGQSVTSKKEGSLKSASDGMKSVSSETIPAIDMSKLFELETKNQISTTNNISQKIYKRLSDQCPNTISATTVPTKKGLSYKGYKIEYCINLVGDLTPRKNDDAINNTHQPPLPSPKRINSVRSQRPKSQTQSRLSTKRSDRDAAALNYTSMSFASKSDYLTLPNVVSKPPENVQSRPTTSVSTRAVSRNRLMNNTSLARSTNTPVAASIADNNKSLTTVKIKQMQPVKATQEFKDSYLSSLKRSGLINDYCVPIMRSKVIRGVIATK